MPDPLIADTGIICEHYAGAGRQVKRDPQDICATCGHSRAMHRRGMHSCRAMGCRCMLFRKKG